ncbi:MAG: hypothetical protein KGI27_14495, partial [Thaumarchaeota archaeon]|nr:hypothetical protein [Nitrososphaerota archaeon]
MIQEIIKNELVNLVAGFDYPIIGKANERVELEIKSAAVAKKSFIEYLNNNEKFDESIVAEICKKLVKKTPEELLNEFIEDGHYKEVYGLSFDELGSINDLSEKKY